MSKEPRLRTPFDSHHANRSKIVRIYRNQFQCNYQKHKKLFPIYLLHFWNLYKILNILKQKDDPRFRTPFGSQHAKRVQNTAEICTVALLSYFLITRREIELEKVSLSDVQNLRTVWWEVSSLVVVRIYCNQF